MMKRSDIAKRFLSETEKIIVIIGPTGCGKSNFAYKMAKESSREIICADSRLIYKDFSIGVAKPDNKILEDVKHHLINFVEPYEDYNVSNFQNDAKKIIEKQKIGAIVAGGTNLYFKALFANYNIPKVEPDFEFRKECEKFTSEDLWNILRTKDVITSEKIHKNNKVKIIRALEIIERLKIKISSLENIRKEYDDNVIWLGLDYERRGDLYEKINKRVDQMISAGLIEETDYILRKYKEILNSNNVLFGKVYKLMKSTIGYSEIIDFFEKKDTIENAIEKIKQNSRNYAKRQLSWMRQNSRIIWLDAMAIARC